MKNIFPLLIILLVFSACSKEEGEGGNATIKGKVFANDFDSDGEFVGQYYVSEADVYIVYGDDDFYNDNVKTHHDGSFRFEYLRPGNYQLYTYSKCRTCVEPQVPVFVDVVIAENDQVIELEDIVIQE